MSSDDYRVEIRDCAAGSQNGVAVHETNNVAHFFQDKMFHQNENGRNLVGEPVVGQILC